MFFDLIDIALVNSRAVYTKRDNNISLLNFKLVVTKAFIGGLVDTVIVRDCSPQVDQASKIRREVPTHMPEFQEMPLLQE